MAESFGIAQGVGRVASTGRARTGGRGRGLGRTAASAPATDLTRAIVDEVAWYMTQHKVSRADLAQSMGVSPGRVSQILSGDENLTLRTLSSVCTALDADFEVTLRPADENP
ncbi:MAG TPA: helix-turn-helix transcriptional regulator [Trebonia sp.]|nr:helix-turn-helix transcriptional regulator [Trebonia sp.]